MAERTVVTEPEFSFIRTLASGVEVCEVCLSRIAKGEEIVSVRRPGNTRRPTWLKTMYFCEGCASGVGNPAVSPLVTERRRVA